MDDRYLELYMKCLQEKYHVSYPRYTKYLYSIIAILVIVGSIVILH